MKPNQLAVLWEKVCLSDEKAFEMLHNSISSEVHGYAKKIVRDGDVADDLVQELFIRLWLKKEKIGLISNVKAYLYKSIQSAAFNYLRGVKQRQRFEENFVYENQIPSIEEYLIAEESCVKLRMTMRKAIDLLPVKQKEMIKLTFYDQLNYHRVIKHTGIKYQSAVNHVHRAITVLRKEFRSKGDILAA